MGVEFSTEPDSPLKGWFDEIEESARAERRARDERIIRAAKMYFTGEPVQMFDAIAAAEGEQ